MFVEVYCQVKPHDLEFVSESDGEITWACRSCPYRELQFQDCGGGR